MPYNKNLDIHVFSIYLKKITYTRILMATLTQERIEPYEIVSCVPHPKPVLVNQYVSIMPESILQDHVNNRAVDDQHMNAMSLPNVPY
ncbi:hypothetical protein E4T48_06463 [Aureobasidium sp. EXF-10727]|nr:hypothetical protein E4T48_06463 [Aureobasidium sp. EXF-10727]